MEITKQQILVVGSELRRVLKSSAFETAVDILRKDFSNRILASAPHEQDARERAYLQSVTLDDLLGVMQTLAVMAENELLASTDETE